MLSVVSWQCNCGMKVKAMYETDHLTEVRCPNAFCKITHTVDGQISELGIKDDGTDWQRYDFSTLIVR